MMRRTILVWLTSAMLWAAPTRAQAQDPKPQWSNGGVDNCRHGSRPPPKEICDDYYRELAAECRADRGYFEKFAPGVDQWACYSCPEDWKATSRTRCEPVKKAPVFPAAPVEPKPKPAPSPTPQSGGLGPLPTVDTPGTSGTPKPKPKPKPKPAPDPAPDPEPKTPTPPPEPEPTAEPAPSFEADGPFDAACNLDPDRFEREWIRYSDIDERIPVNERSFAAKQLVELGQQIRELETAREQLRFDLEVNEFYLEGLHEYRDAVAKNLKQNLIKSFFRLAYVTYATVKSAGGTREFGRFASKTLSPKLGGSILGHGTGWGHNFQKLLDGQVGTVEKLKNFHALAKSLAPQDAYASDQQKLARHGLETAIQTALDIGDAMGRTGADQFQSAFDAMNNFGGAVNKVVLPSADLSREELRLLADHNAAKLSTEQAIVDAVQISTALRQVIARIDAELDRLHTEVPAMLAREKDRVRVMLEEDCRAQLMRFIMEQTGE